jgi:hypothetical protein
MSVGMGYVADHLADGRWARTLTIVDLFTRECLCIYVGSRLRVEGAVTELTHLKEDRGLTTQLFHYDGPELSGGMIC